MNKTFSSSREIIDVSYVDVVAMNVMPMDFVNSVVWLVIDLSID